MADKTADDQRLMLNALNEAARLVSQYIEPGPRNAETTLGRLIEVLDNQGLAAAIERLEQS